MERKKSYGRKSFNDKNYFKKVLITNDSKDILNATLVERILSENVIAETSNKTIEINDSYYLVAPRAYDNISSTDIRIKDSTNSKYYVVKVEVVNNESKDDLIYEAIKVLATNNTLVSDCMKYYLEKYKY